MTIKEAISTLNKYRNSHYNSAHEEEREIANALNVLLPEYAKLVEKDTPMKIIKKENKKNVGDDYYNVDDYYCPKCSKHILRDRFQNPKFWAYKEFDYKGCPYCLQILYWSDENE